MDSNDTSLRTRDLPDDDLETRAPATKGDPPGGRAAHPTDSLGSSVGRIRLLDILGQGGMGTVYLGRDEALDRKVAVKMLRHDRANADARARLAREARLLSRLEHPNICRIHDLIEGEGQDRLVLEYIEGPNLRQAIRGGLGPKEKIRFAIELASVLVAAHARGVIHRDLKPDNVLVSTEGSIKVLDFGLARSDEAEIRSTVWAGEGEGPRSESQVGETALGTVMGTVGYMSPEQARGESVTPASDIYSLGLLLQELFTGSPPYDSGLSPKELLRRTANGENKPARGLSMRMTRILEQLKRANPDERPAASDVHHGPKDDDPTPVGATTPARPGREYPARPTPPRLLHGARRGARGHVAHHVAVRQAG